MFSIFLLSVFSTVHGDWCGQSSPLPRQEVICGLIAFNAHPPPEPTLSGASISPFTSRPFARQPAGSPPIMRSQYRAMTCPRLNAQAYHFPCIHQKQLPDFNATEVSSLHKSAVTSCELAAFRRSIHRTVCERKSIHYSRPMKHNPSHQLNFERP